MDKMLFSAICVVGGIFGCIMLTIIAVITQS